MGFNQIINYPVQGTAGEMVCRAMARLSRMAYETGQPWLCPIVNEHDNLIIEAPLEHFEDAAETMLRVMLDMSEYKSWMHVPILVEAEKGPAWGSLEKVGEFSSEDIVW